MQTCVCVQESVVHVNAFRAHVFSGRAEVCPPARTGWLPSKILEKLLKDFQYLRFNTVWSRYTLYRIDCEESSFKSLDALMTSLPTSPRMSRASDVHWQCVQRGLWARVFIAHCVSKRLETAHMSKLEIWLKWIMKDAIQWNIMRPWKRTNQLYVKQHGVNSELYSVGKARCGTVCMYKMWLRVCVCTHTCLSLKRPHICCVCTEIPRSLRKRPQ